MIVKRSKGRPRRSSGDAGRQLLVAAALDLMREPQIDLNRKALAGKAGVTPALVTYYFADQSSIFDAVVQPVAERYLLQLHEIVHSTRVAVEKFKDILILFLRIARVDGRMLDGYITFAKKHPKAQLDFLASAGRELSAFFHQCEEEGLFRSSFIPLTQTVLWGACKIVAQTPQLNAMLFDASLGDAEMEERQAGMIMDLLLRGLAKPPG